MNPVSEETHSSRLLRWVPRIAWLYLQVVGRTSRLIWEGKATTDRLSRERKGLLYAFWHGRQVSFVWSHRNTGNAAIVSRSKDGELIARVMQMLGMEVARGSSSRGGARAWVEMKRFLESGKSVGFTPDGPKGPQRTVSPGVVYLARKTGIPILPITNSARRKVIFHGWDEYWVPLPFNRIRILHGRPISVQPSDSIEEKSRELAAELNRITEEADALCRADGGLGETLAFFFYDILLFLLSPFLIAGLWLRYPKSFLRNFFLGPLQRLGRLHPPPAIAAARPVWIHAASLGECRAAGPLVQALRKRFSGLRIVFSCTTPAGIAEARKMGLGDFVFYAPVDLSLVQARAFRILNPRLVLLLESEIWPNWTRAAHARGVPLGIVNGRLSERSARRYAALRFLSGLWMRKIRFVCAREEQDAERFRRLAIDSSRIRVTGNLKYDLFPWESEKPERPAPSAPIWTAGSIRSGEESLVLEAYRDLLKVLPALRLILAPRHFENLNDTIGMVTAAGLRWARKSREASSHSHWQVLLWDTFGNLWEAYRDSAVVFVGGSLVAQGGQNPIEPAFFAKPVLFGPSMENFASPARFLVEQGGARQVQSGSELKEALADLLKHPARSREMGEKARQAVLTLKGKATEATLKAIEVYLDE